MGATLPLESSGLSHWCNAVTLRHGSRWAAAVHQHSVIKGMVLPEATCWQTGLQPMWTYSVGPSTASTTVGFPSSLASSKAVSRLLRSQADTGTGHLVP